MCFFDNDLKINKNINFLFKNEIDTRSKTKNKLKIE